MSLQLYGHPFSSYSWKAMIALHEKALPYRLLIVEEEAVMAGLRAHWPIGKFPVLLDAGVPVIEATTIIEHLDLRHAAPARLIPQSSVARCIEEARPYRGYFPLGAPDRD
jgi:glutathione S-transferase